MFSVRLILIYDVIGLWFFICGGFYLLGQELLTLSYTLSVHRTICIRRLLPKGIERLVPPIENNEERSIRYTVSMFSSPLT